MASSSPLYATIFHPTMFACWRTSFKVDTLNENEYGVTNEMEYIGLDQDSYLILSVYVNRCGPQGPAFNNKIHLKKMLPWYIILSPPKDWIASNYFTKNVSLKFCTVSLGYVRIIKNIIVIFREILNIRINGQQKFRRKLHGCYDWPRLVNVKSSVPDIKLAKS